MYRGRGDITNLGVARVACTVGLTPGTKGIHGLGRDQGNPFQRRGS